MRCRGCAFTLLIVTLFLTLCSCMKVDSTKQCLSSDSIICYLAVGYDDAASNTDAIELIALNSTKNSIAMMQIPRDTFINYGTVQNKINQIYPKAISEYSKKRKSGKLAMDELCRVISQTLGVKIDGYAAVSIDGVAKAVDAIGGVEVNVPNDLSYKDETDQTVISIPAGKQTLDGEKAVKFLRFRTGYTNGDLGRIDAQKIFVSAVLKKLSESQSLSTAVPFINAISREMNTDISRMEMLTCAMRFLPQYHSLDISFMTLPGEAVLGTSKPTVSYFAANKKASDEMLSSYFIRTGSFDPKALMYDTKNEDMTRIYESQSLTWKVWTKDELTQ